MQAPNMDYINHADSAPASLPLVEHDLLASAYTPPAPAPPSLQHTAPASCPRDPPMANFPVHEGPSMMDGVSDSDYTSDDALDAWNEHIPEVEHAAIRLLTGDDNTALAFIRAGGEEQKIGRAHV